MALHMILVRINPDAPTSDPAMISTLLSITNPVAAAASPEYEFNRAITTGMSAPPIGLTSRTPNTEARTTIPKYKSISCTGDWPIPPAIIARERATSTSAIRPLTACCAGTWNGRLNIFSSCNLPNATMLPQNVTAPIRPDAAVAVSITYGFTSLPAPRSNSAPATITDAPPPKPFNMPTNWGMSVILIFSASTAPITAPITTPTTRNLKSITCRSNRVTATASNMPSAPRRLPRTAVFGCDIFFRPKMNKMADSR